MRTIPLTQGKCATVDDADFDRVNVFKWHACRSRNTWYAYHTMSPDASGKQSTIKMHRLLMDAPTGIEVDHIDRDGLNNTRSNIRLATSTENKRNRSAWGKSKYLGVDLDARGKKWQARIKSNGKRKYLGYFTNEADAARAYDAAAIKLHGEFANLNFKHNEFKRQQVGRRSA